MSIESTLRAIHPEAKIISVEVDEHEHRDTVCCEVSGVALVSESYRRGCHGVALVPVARIVFVAPGYDQEGEVLSETDNEWAPMSRAMIREALEIWRADVKAQAATDATVSVRGAKLREIDDVFDSLARVA